MQFIILTQQGQYLQIVLPLYFEGFLIRIFLTRVPSSSDELTVGLPLSSDSSKSINEPSEYESQADSVPFNVFIDFSIFKVSLSFFEFFDLLFYNCQRFDELLLL